MGKSKVFVVFLMLLTALAFSSCDSAEAEAEDAGCAAGTTSCDGQCVDLTTSHANCGSCGTACTDDEVCEQSECSTQCSDALTDCAGACVDLTTNDSHCGACDNACDSGGSCSEGECLEASGCDAGWAGCTETDFNNNDKTGEEGVIRADMNPFQNYSPTCIKLKVGQTIVIGATPTHPFKKHCALDGVMDSQDGQSTDVTLTFESEGYYNYGCKFHGGMKGNIQVVP
tara:strand:- start:2 stop:685 length:684 start_codon:yes stop_codon:yes gene_type:complete